MYAADFNCQHTGWGIITPTQMENAWLTGQPGEIFPSCIILNMPLTSFLVTGTNPDLDFVSEDLNSSELDRCTLEKFSRSQH